jgi:hypothetical protein
MSMDDGVDEDDEGEGYGQGPNGLRGKTSARDLLSPAGLDGKDTFIHREELDDQERLDLEEEARERELSGQGFSGAQTSGEPAGAQQQAG